MKTLKAFLTIVTLVTLVSVMSAQQAEKTLVKSFNLKGAQIVLLDLEGDFEVVEWKNTIMRVQMTVSLDNATDSMIKSLVRTGRYNLYSKTDDEGDFTVFAPGMKRDFIVSGKKIDEHISYTVYAPENVIVKMAGEASTDIQSPQGEPSSL